MSVNYSTPYVHHQTWKTDFVNKGGLIGQGKREDIGLKCNPQNSGQFRFARHHIYRELTTKQGPGKGWSQSREYKWDKKEKKRKSSTRQF